MKATRGEFTLSCSNSDQQADRIHAFLTRSYWAAGIPLDLVKRCIAESLCFGAPKKPETLMEIVDAGVYLRQAGKEKGASQPLESGRFRPSAVPGGRGGGAPRRGPVGVRGRFVVVCHPRRSTRGGTVPG